MRVGPEVKAVALDVDGTMYSIRRMVLTNLRVFWKWRTFFRRLHSVRDDMRRADVFEDFRAEQARRYARRHDLQPDQAQEMIHRIIDERWPVLFDRIAPFTGLTETLRRLQSRDVRLAILSDYPVHRKIQGLGLSGIHFSAVVESEQVGALKPHPAPFRLLSEELDLSPEQIVYIGDQENTDVLGALDAGLQAVRFYERPPRPSTRASFAFRDWRQLIPLMRFKSMLFS